MRKDYLKDYKQVENIKVLFKVVQKKKNNKTVEYIYTVIQFPNHRDFLLIPSTLYKPSQKALYRDVAKEYLFPPTQEED